MPRLKVSPEKLSEVCEKIRSDRVCAYRRDPELVAFARRVCGPLETYGYQC